MKTTLESGYEDAEIVKEYDFTPEDKSEYIYYAKSEELRLLGPIYSNAVNLEETKKELYDWTERKWKYLERNATENSEQMGYVRIYEQVSSGFGTGMFFYSATLGDDLSKRIFAAQPYNLIDSYGLQTLIVYIGVTVLSIILTLMTAYRTFLKLQAQYQIDEYRRNTTNTMAHDLKSPLMAISGYAENLKSAVHEEKREYYENAILENVGYMNEIIAKTLELAKIEDAGYQLSYCSVDLLELTHELKKKYEPLAEDRGLEWEIEGNCIIQADKTAMTQVVENLLSNVVKYAAEGSLISIQMTEKAYEIRNGMSQMIEGDIEELWKPFVKGDNSRSGKKGTGIGLTIVKNILDAHQFELNLSQEDNEFVVRVDF